MRLCERLTHQWSIAPAWDVLFAALAVAHWAALGLTTRADEPADSLSDGWRKTIRLAAKTVLLPKPNGAIKSNDEDKTAECIVSVKRGWLMAERRTAGGELEWRIVLAKASDAEPPEIEVHPTSGSLRLSYRQGRYFIRDDSDSLRCLREVKQETDPWPRLELPPSDPHTLAIGQGSNPRLESRTVDSWVIVTSGPAEATPDCLVRLNHSAFSNPYHIGSYADPVVRANAGDKFLVDDGEMLFAERAEDRLVQRKLERRAVRAELVGAAAPELSGKTSPEGQRFGGSELRGKVVLLVFFATWRPTSAEQLPLAEEFYARYREQGLAVVGIHQRIVPGVLEQFVRERKLTFPIVIDEIGSGFYDGVGKTSHRYGVGVEGEDVAGSSPTYFLIDRDRKVQQGYTHEPPAPEEIEKLLAAEPR